MGTIITCSVTGGITRPDQTPYLPITPEQIADSALHAAEAGAAVVHLHVRDPKTGGPSTDPDLYGRVVERIRASNPGLVINLTTGPGGRWTQGVPLTSPEERVRHIEALRPEVCSLDFNTMLEGDDLVRINTKATVTRMLERIDAAGVVPEFEIFGSGDLWLAQELTLERGQGLPAVWQLALGVKYGWRADPETLAFARAQLPPGAQWSAFGVGRNQMPMVARAYLDGGQVRVGLEDNIYLSRGVLARSNAELVSRAAEIIRLLGGTAATPAEARSTLGVLR